MFKVVPKKSFIKIISCRGLCIDYVFDVENQIHAGIAALGPETADARLDQNMTDTSSLQFLPRMFDAVSVAVKS